MQNEELTAPTEQESTIDSNIGQPVIETQDELFSVKPLTERLDSGFDSHLEMVKKQIQYTRKAAVEVDEKGNRPPEVRLGRASSEGLVRLEFTNAMSFPSLSDFIKQNEESGNKLIDLMMLKGEDEVLDENLVSWQIISVGAKLIEIKLEFASPLSVSQGEVSDKLLVQMQLSDFPDENLAFLPTSINRIKELPQ